MVRYKILLFLQCVILLIPLNVYMWGNWLLVNVQWAFVRYQQSPFGPSIIPGYKDIVYIVQGQTTGIYNILAASFWAIGSVLLLLALVLTLIAWVKKRPGLTGTAGIITLCSGILFCFSALVRFIGGFSIPIGVPLILLIGWWMYRQKPEQKDDDNSVDKETTGDE